MSRLTITSAECSKIEEREKIMKPAMKVAINTQMVDKKLEQQGKTMGWLSKKSAKAIIGGAQCEQEARLRRRSAP